MRSAVIVAPGMTALTRLGRKQIDDATAAPGLDHLKGRELRQKKRSFQVGIHGLIPNRLGHLDREAGGNTAALLTRISTLPNRLTAKSMTRCASSALPASAGIPAACPPLRQPSPRLWRALPDPARSGGARLSEAQHYGLADAATAAGDNSTAPLER
jgi:hypothetical protein